MRTIYKQHAQALFKKNFYKKHIKPTEGISIIGFNQIKKIWKDGGMWIWICSSQRTESAKKSFVYGAIFVTDIIPTKEFKKHYKNQSRKLEFKHSAKCDVQAIIPEHDYARLQLLEPIPLHSSVLMDDKDNDKTDTTITQTNRRRSIINKNIKKNVKNVKNQKKRKMEMRVHGIWTPFEGTAIIKQLENATFRK